MQSLDVRIKRIEVIHRTGAVFFALTVQNLVFLVRLVTSEQSVGVFDAVNEHGV